MFWKSPTIQSRLLILQFNLVIAMNHKMFTCWQAFSNKFSINLYTGWQQSIGIAWKTCIYVSICFSLPLSLTHLKDCKTASIVNRAFFKAKVQLHIMASVLARAYSGVWGSWRILSKWDANFLTQLMSNKVNFFDSTVNEIILKIRE